ncbi:MAG TPA: enoyl-CoA hydratase/isomerase family protein [Xanthobacteraceae bacterium]|nr:enoyl-CoA hydratase/isomerase family protein [Xanthobacteraceae bacterium]
MSELPKLETLLLERKGGTLQVWLNRPETKNALNRQMVRDLTAVADLLAGDGTLRAAVVRGANGTFCAGGDINGFKEMFSTPAPKPGEKDGIALHNRGFGNIMTRFEALPQTIVMVIEGAAYGGGLGLMCGGDVVLATADAKFSISETTLGVPPAQIAPFVAARIGVARTRRLALTAHRFDGREAAELGLVDQACAGTAALEATLPQVLAGIARCSPHANATTKQLILASRALPREALLDQSADAFAECLRGPEGQEGVTAFLEKRKPKWAL